MESMAYIEGMDVCMAIINEMRMRKMKKTHDMDTYYVFPKGVSAPTSATLSL